MLGASLENQKAMRIPVQNSPCLQQYLIQFSLKSECINLGQEQTHQDGWKNPF